jgi:hypothetical protein
MAHKLAGILTTTLSGNNGTYIGWNSNDYFIRKQWHINWREFVRLLYPETMAYKLAGIRTTTLSGNNGTYIGWNSNDYFIRKQWHIYWLEF